jgi:hypothetical protein
VPGLITDAGEIISPKPCGVQVLPFKEPRSLIHNPGEGTLFFVFPLGNPLHRWRFRIFDVDPMRDRPHR